MDRIRFILWIFGFAFLGPGIVFAQSDSRPVDWYSDHSNLLVIRDADGNERSVKTPADWSLRTAHIRAGMQLVMGPLPSRSDEVPLDVQYKSREELDGYVRSKILYSPESGDQVPAWLLVPNDRVGSQKYPAMLCLHQTNHVGKDEPVGLGGLESLAYAHELAKRGYVCLVPDYPSFGEYPYDFLAHGSAYVSGSMKAVWNNMRGVDFLASMEVVDAERIGCIGHSLGGHNALFTAVFDERIKAVVTSCGFTPFHDYYHGNVTGWTSDRYMPRIKEIYGNDANKIPFDFYEILAAIAPRGCFSNSPLRDSNFEIEGVRRAFLKADEVFRLFDANRKLVLVTPDSLHEFPNAVRYQSYEWLDGQLKR